MKILVVGIAGFIGSHIAEFYTKIGCEVVGIDNLRKEPNNLDYLRNTYHKMRIYIEDIRDYESLELIIKREQPNVIIHTAGQTAVTTSLIEPMEDFEINVIGTVNLLEIVRKLGLKIPFIFCSTNKVYGTLPTVYPTGEDERTDISPFTPYGCSKNAAEKYVLEYAHQYGIKAGIFRMSCIYGTRQFGTEDQGWVAHFILSAIEGNKINIFGDGHQIRDILYVTDLVEAFNRFINIGTTGIWNLGGGPFNTISLLQLIDMLEYELDKNIKKDFYDPRAQDQKVYISNIDKIIQDFHWRPEVGTREGVRKIIDWWYNEREI